MVGSHAPFTRRMLNFKSREQLSQANKKLGSIYFWLELSGYASRDSTLNMHRPLIQAGSVFL